MVDVRLHSILRNLRRIVGPKGVGGLNDAQLLERVTAGHDEAAFEVLVWRHGPMVLGLCRRVLRHEQDAEDAFQATFLTLARKADSLRTSEALAGWLYQVAYRIALRARAEAAKRALHERPEEKPRETIVNEEPADSLALRELRSVLDEELVRLPQKYRTPLILCDLQGMSHAQAARELGQPLGSMSRHLRRARALLRRRLTRRGVTLSCALLAPAVAEASAAALPATLARPTAEAALLFAQSSGAAGAEACGRAVVLAQGALRSMVLDKLKVVLALLLASLTATGAGLLVHWSLGAGKPQARQVWPEPAAQDPGLPAATNGRSTRVDANGDPLPPGAIARLGTVRLRHGGRVSAVALSPDGKTLASACDDRSVRLWDVTTGKLLHRLKGPESPALAVAFSPDGKTLASGNAEGTIHLWDPTTGKELRQLGGQLGRVQSLAFAPDGRTLASASAEDMLRVWEVATGKELALWVAGHKKQAGTPGDKETGLWAVAFSPDGQTLAACGSDGTVSLWEAPTGKALRRISAHHRTAFAVAFSPDSKILAAGGEDLVRLFDVGTGQERGRLEGQKGPVRSVAFASDGESLVTGDGEGSVFRWEATSGKLLHRLEGHHGPIASVALSDDGTVLASGSHDHTIRLWNPDKGKQLLSFDGHQSALTTVAFSPDGRLLATAGYDNVIRLWETAAGKEVRQLHGHEGGVTSMAFSPDGKLLLTASVDRIIRVWDAATGGELRQFQGHQDRITSLTVSPDGRLLATASMDRSIRLWDVTLGDEIRRFGGFPGYILRVAFAPDGKSLASAGTDNTIRLWDVTTGNEMRRVGEGHGWPLCVAFSPDGKMLATGRKDGLIRLWEVSTGRLLHELKGHRNWVSTLAFSPDGKMLASSSYTGALRLWEVATGRERYRSEGHRAAAWHVAFSADGRLLASASSDTTALLWDVTAQALVEPPQGARLSDRQLEAIWDDLTEEDALRAYRATGLLQQAPVVAVPFLWKRLQQAAATDGVRIARLVRLLDDDAFQVRESASRELEKLGDAAEPALRKLLEDNPSLELRRRVEPMLEALKGRAPSPHRLCVLRATELLEQLATPEARQLLEEMAKGPPESPLAQEANRSLDRLARRPDASSSKRP